MAKTIADLAREALAVQDACNLTGVVHGFSRAMTDLCAHVNGTDARASHPITILWVDKLAHLSGYQQDLGDTVQRAYAECFRLAE